MFKFICKDFISFWKKPEDTQYSISFVDKIKAVSTLFVINAAVVFAILYPLLNLLDNVVEVEYNDLSGITYTVQFLLVVLIVPLLEETIFRLLLRHTYLKTFIKRYNLPKIFSFLSYLLLIIFALLHLSNIDNKSTLTFIFSPLLVAPQLILGMIVTFLRVRLNFMWGYLYHCLWNFLVFMIFEFKY